MRLDEVDIETFRKAICRSILRKPNNSQRSCTKVSVYLKYQQCIWMVCGIGIGIDYVCEWIHKFSIENLNLPIEDWMVVEKRKKEKRNERPISMNANLISLNGLSQFFTLCKLCMIRICFAYVRTLWSDYNQSLSIDWKDFYSIVLLVTDVFVAQDKRANGRIEFGMSLEMCKIVSVRFVYIFIGVFRWKVGYAHAHAHIYSIYFYTNMKIL